MIRNNIAKMIRNNIAKMIRNNIAKSRYAPLPLLPV